MKQLLCYLAILACSHGAQASEWIVMALQPQAEASFVEITLPEGVTATFPSHGGLLDERSQALKWGPLEASISAVSFTVETDQPEALLTVASWPDTATAAPSIQTSKDADGDGLSEQVENRLGTSDLDPTDADGDLDHDGRSNLAETLAGSDPQSASSLTAAGEASYDAASGQLNIRLPQEIKLEGMLIETATSLAAPVWETVSEWSHLSQNDEVTTIQIDVEAPTASPSRFFRFRWGK